MKPFIINTHTGEEENQVLLFISYSKSYLMPKRKNSNVILFCDELEKRGHKVLEFNPTSFFANEDSSEKDGGYTFTIIPADNKKPEEQLLKDTWEIIKNLIAP